MNKKVRNIAIWSGISIYIIVALAFASNRYNKMLCVDINLIILDTNEAAMIDTTEIVERIAKYNKVTVGMPIKDFNTNLIERTVILHPAIKNAQVYRGINGILNIEIDQNNPIVRVINKDNESLYIDEDGSLFPVSEKYITRTLVASGNIDFELKPKKKRLKKEIQKIKDIYELSKYIANDPFWRAQIEQIFINSADEFELIPRVGNHVYLLGDISNYEKKMEKLLIFYENGLKYAGWNKYKIINLKFKNQVVCSK